MRIAQVAPLYESVPPRLYGGTERVVSYLTEELVRRGHQVTLFASGDSVTAAELVPGSPTSLRLDPSCRDPLAHHVVMLEEVFRRASDFDLVHFHVDYLHFPLSRRYRIPRVSTLHGCLEIPDLAPLYREFPDEPVVSISDAQRAPLPALNWLATVHHGFPENLYPFGAGTGSYLAFLGRISPEKRVDRAIEIAGRAGLPLKIAAKVDDADRDYYEARIKPLLERSTVEYVGEIGEAEKGELLGGALALLFPIEWSEPFGMVTIEAMACGTPVVAWPLGSVPEIVEHGVTGFLVGSVGDAVDAVRRVGGLSRRACRRTFERRFTVGRMAEDYLAIYERVAAGVTSPLPGRRPPVPALRLRSGRPGSLPRESEAERDRPARADVDPKGGPKAPRVA